MWQNWDQEQSRMLNTYIGTFGVNHTLGKNFVRVTADNYTAARELMFQIYGQKWAFLYSSELEAGVEMWKLTEVPLGTPNEKL
jgi:hypothetical protein